MFNQFVIKQIGGNDYMISQSQIEYMLQLIYSEDALLQQFKSGQQFFVAYYNNEAVGFTSIQHSLHQQQKQTKLHKLYLNPEYQGRGWGVELYNYAINLAKENGSELFYLNVNKYNKTISFYKQRQLQILTEEVIDIGGGYVMDDYVMGINLL
jgi:diamine N-acetyltransferase